MPRCATITALLVSSFAAAALAASTDAPSHKPMKVLHPELESGQDIWALSWSPDGSHLLIEHGLTRTSLQLRHVQLWNIDKDAPSLKLHRYGNAKFRWSHDHQRLAVAGTGHISIHDIATGEITAQIEHQDIRVPAHDNWWSPDERWVMTKGTINPSKQPRELTLQLLDLHNPEADPIRLTLSEQNVSWPAERLAWDVHWTRQGPLVAIGRKRGDVLLWSPLEDERQSVAAHNSRITSLAWSRAGDRLAIGAHDGTAHIVRIPPEQHNAANHAPIRIDAHDEPIRQVAFVSDDAHLVTTTHYTLRHDDPTSQLWNTEDGAHLGAASTTKIANAAASRPTRCGRFILRVEASPRADEPRNLPRAPAMTASVQILDAANESTLARLQMTGYHTISPKWSIELCAQSPDNARLALPTADRTIGLWNLDEIADD